MFKFVGTKLAIVVVLSLLFGGLSARADGIQLITNGNFATGFTGWTMDNEGNGSWYVLSGTTEPNPSTLGGSIFPTTVGPYPGDTYYASSDQSNPGAHALIQTFTVPIGDTSIDLSFDMFANNYGGSTNCNNGVDYTTPNTECGFVAILAAGSTLSSPTLVDLLYMGSDPLSTNPNPYTAYNYDLSSVLTPGTTYVLAFAEADNQGPFNMGIDNVSMIAAPEPGTLGLALMGFGLLVLVRKRLVQ